MTISLKHAFQSTKADGTDNTLVQPSDWNEEHTLTIGTGKLVGRYSSGTGPAQEISIGTGVEIVDGALRATEAGNIADAIAAADAAEAAAVDAVAAAGGAAAITPSFPASADYVPLFRDAANNVAIWLEDGKLCAPALGATLQASLKSDFGLSSTADAVDDPALVPLFRDTTGNVPLWLEDGKLAAAGVADGLLTAILTGMAGTLSGYAPTSSVPSRGSQTLTTDGRTLRKYKRFRGKYKALATGNHSFALVGDSWTSYQPFSQAMFNWLVADTQLAGPGFISLGSGATLLTSNGVTALSVTGFSEYDVDGSGHVAPTRGCGPDGTSRYATGTTATASITATMTNCAIYYWNATGANWRYRIDGGSWTTVTGSGAGAKAKASISGLTDAAHTIDIDLTGNTSTVEFYGFWPTRSGRAGITVHKIGNGGMCAADFTVIKSHLGYWATELAVETAHVMLGTNDWRNDYTTSVMQTGITDVIQTLLPNAGIINTIPAEGGETHTNAQSLYSAANLATANTLGVEYYYMAGDWQSYAIENAAGAWADSAHPWSGSTDATGSAQRVLAVLTKNFLA